MTRLSDEFIRIDIANIFIEALGRNKTKQGSLVWHLSRYVIYSLQNSNYYGLKEEDDEVFTLFDIPVIVDYDNPETLYLLEEV